MTLATLAMLDALVKNGTELWGAFGDDSFVHAGNQRLPLIKPQLHNSKALLYFVITGKVQPYIFAGVKYVFY